MITFICKQREHWEVLTTLNTGPIQCLHLHKSSDTNFIETLESFCNVLFDLQSLSAEPVQKIPINLLCSKDKDQYKLHDQTELINCVEKLLFFLNFMTTLLDNQQFDLNS